MKTNKKPFILLLSLLITCHFAPLQTQAQETIQLETTTLTVESVVEDLDTPWEILWGPDDWIWLTERGCNVKRINPETGEVSNLLNIGDCHEEEESGLLGMVLHPIFEVTPHLFLVYTYLENDAIKERCVRYTYNESTQQLTEPFVLIEDIKGNTTHDGSRLLILPDQTLLMSTGDAQDQAASQDTEKVTGKFLRMNLDGSVPTDNPFGNLVYSIGHRNAQGLVMASNGTLYSSEHGPNNDDELNIIQMGENYGWPNVHGYCNGATEMNFCETNNVVEPLMAWTPTLAVAGIDYYDHEAIPEWRNSILMTTLKEQDLRILKLNEAGDAIVSEEIYLNRDFGRLRDVCVSPDGRIFVAVSNRDGRAFPKEGDDRIVELKSDFETNIEEIPSTNFTLFPNPNNGFFTFSWQNLSSTSNYQLYIADIYGKEVYRYEGNKLQNSIDLTTFASGIYFLQVQQNEQVWASKIMVH